MQKQSKKNQASVPDLDDWEEGRGVVYSVDKADRVVSKPVKRPTTKELLEVTNEKGKEALQSVKKVLNENGQNGQEKKTPPRGKGKKGVKAKQEDDGLASWLRASKDSEDYYDSVDQFLQEVKRKSLSGGSNADSMEVDEEQNEKKKKKGKKNKEKEKEDTEMVDATKQNTNANEGQAQTTREEESEEERKDRINREFRDLWMKEVTESFADDLDELKTKEEMDGNKISLLIDCLEVGMDVFTDFEKEFKVTHFKEGKHKNAPWHAQWASGSVN